MFKKFFANIKERFLTVIGMYRQIALDNKNRKIFRDTLDEAFADRESEFVKRNLKYIPETYDIVYTLRIPAEFQQSGRDYMILDKLNESTYFLTDFLRNTVGFGDYVSGIPEYFHVEDPSSDDVSLTYLAMWKFNPVISDTRKKWLTYTPVAAGLLVAGIIIGIFLF